jgi:hypothetical protein
MVIFAMVNVYAGENYTLEINGQIYDIGLDEVKKVVLSGGTELKLKLTLKDYINFESQIFSFSHTNAYRPNKTDLGDGVYQTVIMTSLGTGIIIQEYTTMDPSTLIDMMLKELTKEEIEYGYKYEEKEIAKMVGNKKLKGKEAVTTYKDEKWTRSVYSFGQKDSGILVITFIEQENFKAEKKVIDDFWTSLEIKL